LHVQTCSGRNRIIPLMRRPNTNSAPNMPVTLPRNQLLIRSWSRVRSTLSRYGVTVRDNVTNVYPQRNQLRAIEEMQVLVDGRMGSRLRGYHPVAPRTFRYGPFVHNLYFRPSTPEALHLKRYDRPLLVKNGITGVKWPVNLVCDSDFHVNRRDILHAANLRHERRLYFPSEGRHAVDFFVRKIRWLRPGSNPTEANTGTVLTTITDELNAAIQSSLLQF
jgi:hypothetical protein